MTRRPPTIPPVAVAALRRTVAGLIAYPADPVYDSLADGHDRTCVRPDARPDVVVIPSSEDGVAAAVAIARQHGIRLAGRSTGGPPAMLLLTDALDEVVVDAASGTALVGPGATWAALATAATEAGLSAGPAPHTVAPASQAVLAGAVEAVSLRVVREDGFVHVVADPGPGDSTTGVVTAIVVRLQPAPAPTPTPERTPS